MPERYNDTFCIDDIQIFGLKALAAVIRQQKNVQTGREISNKDLSSELPPDIAPIVTEFLFSGAGGLTKEGKAFLYKCTALRRVETQWGIKDIGLYYGWHRHGTRFCDEMRALSKEFTLTVVAPLARRVVYDRDVECKSELDLSLLMCHLVTIREKQAHILPLASVADLPPEKRENYEVDEHGFLQRSLVGKRKWLQKEALSFRARLSPKNIAQVSDYQLSVITINLFLQHLTKQSKAKILFRKATLKEKFEGIHTVSDNESSFFDSIVVPFRYDGWWYVAVRRDVRREQWTVLVLSEKAPSPPKWPTETEVLRLPDATHRKLESNFLVFPCLRAILAGLPQFSDAIQQHQICCDTDVATVVAEVKEIVEAAVLRSCGEKASVEHDSIAKAKQEAAETLAGLASSRPSSKQNDLGPDNTRADETRGAASRDNYLELVKGVPTRHDIKTLDDGQRLNDVMINFGLHILGQQHPEKVFFYNSFLVEELQQGKSCAEWTKRANPAEYDNIVVPIHDPGRMHWLVALLWRDTSTTAAIPTDDDQHGFALTILDPLGSGTHEAYLRLLREYLAHLGVGVVAKNPPKGLPTQDNNYDCGPFVHFYVEKFLLDPRKFVRVVEEGASLQWDVDAGSTRNTMREAAEVAEELASTAKTDDAKTPHTPSRQSSSASTDSPTNPKDNVDDDTQSAPSQASPTSPATGSRNKRSASAPPASIISPKRRALEPPPDAAASPFSLAVKADTTGDSFQQVGRITIQDATAKFASFTSFLQEQMAPDDWSAFQRTIRDPDVQPTVSTFFKDTLRRQPTMLVDTPYGTPVGADTSSSSNPGSVSSQNDRFEDMDTVGASTPTENSTVFSRPGTPQPGYFSSAEHDTHGPALSSRSDADLELLEEAVARLTKRGFSPSKLIEKIQSRTNTLPLRTAINDGVGETEASSSFANYDENNALRETSVHTYMKCATVLPVIPSIFLHAVEAFKQQEKNVNTLYKYLRQTPDKGWPWCLFRRIITTGNIGPSVQSCATAGQDVCFVVKIEMERDADTLLERLEHEVGNLERKSSRLYEENGCYSCIISNEDGSLLLCLVVGFRAYGTVVFAESVTVDVF